MPRFKNVRERILWEYAKLISNSAMGKGTEAYWPFAVTTFAKLRDKTIVPSSVLRENQLLVRTGGVCAYCDDSDAKLQWEHIIPRSKGGPDTIDNMVQACQPCNSAKGARDPLQWYGTDRDAIPRLVIGKLLKLLYEAHAAAGTLEETSYPPGGDQPSLMALMTIFAQPAASSLVVERD